MRPRLRLRRPAPTVRLRLTVLYGLTFLITGAILLTIGYVLVRHNLAGDRFRRRAFAGPGSTFLRPPGVAHPTQRELAFAKAVHDQLVSDSLHRLVLEYLLALVAMTGVSAGAGWLLAGRALRPLREITATARRVSGENLGERIGLTGPADELRELAGTIDGMLERLDRAFSSQRHFVASASHELRTPLAIMRTEIDVALADEEASIGDLRGMGEALRETIDRCERLIEGLLMLARSEASGGTPQLLDLAELAADCVTDDTARARAAGVTISSELRPAPVTGERALLERTIANLVENGIRHNSPGGWLSVRTEADSDGSRLVVANGGPQIAQADLDQLTEPFRRLNPARPGFGLGLSIVRSVVAAHDGRLALRAPASGGLEVEIRLPAAAAPARPNVELARSGAPLTRS